MRILVLAAHPDDEVYGAGGAIARYAGEGAEVYVAILTEGCSAQYPGDNNIIGVKREEALRAAGILGVKEVAFYDLPDMKLDSVPHVDINGCIEECIGRFKPEIIFTHHGGDVNLDHCRVYESTLVAVRPLQGRAVKKVYSYEAPSSTEWAASHYKGFVPNTFINIARVLKDKLAAVQAYNTELRPYPHPRSLEAVEVYSRQRGISCGLEYAEAFILLRELQL